MATACGGVAALMKAVNPRSHRLNLTVIISGQLTQDLGTLVERPLWSWPGRRHAAVLAAQANALPASWSPHLAAQL
jgi:hypothetical protein